MSKSTAKELYAEIRELPCIEACVLAVRCFWEGAGATNAENTKFFNLFMERKDECWSEEARIDLAVALYNEYKATSNLFAYRFAKVIMKDL